MIQERERDDRKPRERDKRIEEIMAKWLFRVLWILLELTGIAGQGVPFETLLKQCQMLFQPPDLLPFDPGYFSVPVHVPKSTNNTMKASVFKKQRMSVLFTAVTNTVGYTIKASANFSRTCPCRA